MGTANFLGKLKRMRVFADLLHFGKNYVRTWIW
jgi:hypothetical protein